AQLLGQRRGGRGDDAAGRLVTEGLEGDERTEHLLPPGSLVSTTTRPLLPPAARLSDGLASVRLRRRLLVRGIPAEDIRQLLPRGNGKVGHGGELFSA